MAARVLDWYFLYKGIGNDVFIKNKDSQYIGSNLNNWNNLIDVFLGEILLTRILPCISNR